MIELPVTAKKGDRSLIKSMLIVSRPKVGKTEALMQLPNSLLIDLEDSSDYFDGTAINVLEECKKLDKGPISVLNMIGSQIQEKNKANDNKPIYKYGIIDTITRLEEYCEPYATMLYKKTAQGQTFKGKSVVAELEYGAGYLWLRSALEGVLQPFFGLFETLILTAHVKDSSINMRGKSIAVTDIGLTGKIKQIMTGKCDAIGTMYRHPDEINTNVLSFKTTASDVITGARPAHLSNQEFRISEQDPESKELTTHWDKIFLSEKK